MFVSLVRVGIVYIVKEVTSFWGLGQLMGVAHKRTRTRETDQQENANCCIQHRNSIKMMQESLKSKHNKLLCFRHEESSFRTFESTSCSNQFLCT